MELGRGGWLGWGMVKGRGGEGRVKWSGVTLMEWSRGREGAW